MSRCFECGTQLDETSEPLVCSICGSKYEIEGKKDVYFKDDIFWTYHKGIRNLTLESTESGLRKLLNDKLKVKGVFIDIGANLGVHAINLAKTFERVVAIEPHPLNIGLMLETIELNGIKNVDVYQLAAWNRPFVLKLSRQFKYSTDGSIFTTEKSLDSGMYEEIDVPGLPIDCLNLKPDCIKIDVEGAEENVLCGLTETLVKYKPVVIVEIHMLFGANEESILKFMRQYGYECKKLLHSDGNTSHYVFWSGDSISDFDSEDYNSDMACTFSRPLDEKMFFTINKLKRVK